MSEKTNLSDKIRVFSRASTASRPTRRARRQVASGTSDSSTPQRKLVKRIDVDHDMLAEGRAWVREKRRELGRQTLTVEVLDVVSTHLYLRHQAWLTAQETDTPSKHNFAHEVAALLGRNSNLCSSAWKAFADDRELHLPPASAGPRGFKPQRIRRTKALRVAIRNFLYYSEARGERVVVDDLTRYLCQTDHFPAHMCEVSGKERLAVRRCVQRLVNDLGLRHGPRRGIKYREKGHRIALRNKYIQTMLQSRDGHRIVYVDESYILHHHSDPEEAQQATHGQHTGQRICFIGAIIGADPTVPEAQRLEQHHAQLLENTVDIFAAEQNAGTHDYHKSFTAEYFAGWMDKLIAELARLNVKNAIIVMDGAKYHKSLPPTAPQRSQHKVDLIAACRQVGMDVDSNLYKKEIWAQARAWIRANMRPETVTKAAAAGHEVLFLPRHYSDLQPIESVWSHIKGQVGHRSKHTFAQVKTALEEAFQNLSHEKVADCIDHSWMTLCNLAAVLERLQARATDSESDSDSDSDSQSDGQLEHDE
ncbi:uncharacterized protein MONBRDRAFT_36127 [Monosiga brevicollis MX1]|uniref:Tc1-like transposase DDE domain-containing protein n=1 Tax=Monosiga brevicollis TaxID=81824 RepID=A9UT85_MONBE|nr:uncharacterized protein MONBRDRAFT_36127 [Monosiga brevicollis MX1]EDQ91450.1 predicted protein [Monosiga brevicollis MX1]|eukprot:XP_001743872.1 hypothetical protein [Monosiga brevicollis MX1]